MPEVGGSNPPLPIRLYRMKEDLFNLLALQEIDDAIQGLQHSIESLPEVIKQKERRVEEKESLLDEKRANLKEVLKLERSKEREIDEIRDRIVKHERQRLEAKTNIEYQTLTHEIEVEKSKILEIEEDLKLVWERMDALEHEIKELEAETANAKNMLEQEKMQLLAKRKEWEDELDKLKDKRKRLLPHIPELLLQRYERIRKNKGGKGVALVKDNVCTACGAEVPPYKIAILKSYREILTCESCGRILIWKED